MRENRDNISIAELEKENEFLRETVDSLVMKIALKDRYIRVLKEDNAKITSQRNNLQHKLDTVSIWDLSEEAQKEAEHMLAKSLLGGH